MLAKPRDYLARGNEMERPTQCSRCQHRKERFVCGWTASPFHGRVVQRTDTCESFLASAALDALNDGIVLVLGDDSVEGQTAAAADFEKAISLGLPSDEELQARLCRGECLFALVRLKYSEDNVTLEQLAAAPEVVEGLAEMERAVTIDREQEFGHFEDPVERARLETLDVAYDVALPSDSDAAIAYLVSKTQLLAYLSTTPLLRCHLALGNLYKEHKKDDQAALECYRKLLNAEPVRRDEPERDREVRDMAKHNIELIEGATAEKKACFIATAACGNEYAPEVIALQRFRDRYLVHSRIGRHVVTAYTAVSPPVARLASCSTIIRLILRYGVVRPSAYICARLLN